MISADDLRFFLEVARTGRLIAAGKALGVDHTTVGRRLTAFERDVGNRLFDRLSGGWILTESGEILLEHAEAIESSLLAAMESLTSGPGRLSGTVRIATPDCFGAFLLAPRLATLRQQHPDLDVEVVTATRNDLVATREFDVAVTLERPSPRAVEVSELADYRLGLYATSAYLRSHPTIATVLDLHDHTLIGYVNALLDVPSLRILESILPGHRAQIQTNNISAQWQAAAAGLGVAALPFFIGEQDDRLLRILPEDVSIVRRYWLAVPRELQKLARVRAAVAALRALANEEPFLSPA